MISGTVIKIVSLTATIVGGVASIASGWTADQKMKATVAKEVAKAIAKTKVEV